jgi:hypothetical protein
MKILNVQKTQFKISDFLGWQKDKTLDLRPRYQRRSVWDSKKKSFFIDTILKGLPVPIIFIRQQEPDLNTFEQKREVVDGQQRIRTLLSFIRPDLLNDFERERDSFVILKTHNEKFAGKSFSDLDDVSRKQILDYQFSVHVLPSEVEDRELLEIFSRLNSTGIKLNDQELRNAEFFGDFKTSVYRQAITHLERWKKWKIFNEQHISRMDEAELVSELFGVIIDGIKAKTQSYLRSLYVQNDENFSYVQTIENRFSEIMEVLSDLMGNEIGSSAFRKKTLFYILFAVMYDLKFGLNSDIDDTKGKSVGANVPMQLLRAVKDIDKGVAPKDVQDASTRRTTHFKSRDTLKNYFIGKI